MSIAGKNQNGSTSVGALSYIENNHFWFFISQHFINITSCNTVAANKEITTIGRKKLPSNVKTYLGSQNYRTIQICSPRLEQVSSSAAAVEENIRDNVTSVLSVAQIKTKQKHETLLILHLSIFRGSSFYYTIIGKTAKSFISLAPNIKKSITSKLSQQLIRRIQVREPVRVKQETSKCSASNIILFLAYFLITYDQTNINSSYTLMSYSSNPY